MVDRDASQPPKAGRTSRNRRFRCAVPMGRSVCALALFWLCLSRGIFAQGALNANAALPNAPTPMIAAFAGGDGQAPPATGTSAQPGQPEVFKIGPWRDPKALDLSEAAAPLSASDKLKLSFREQLTPFAGASMVFAAGWEQLRNSNPKYGSDGTAFAERVGAAALRQTSQAVLSDGVYAAAFHQDPRYFRLASGTLGKRIFYAVSRTWRTRTDSGTPTVNYSLLFGHATAQALTLTYYPDRSQSGQVAVAGFGWSLLGNMLGNQYHEFWPDILQAIFQRPPAGPKPARAPAEPKPPSTTAEERPTSPQ